MTWRDWIYIPRRRALELGFTHEGTHFGIPVWVEFAEDGSPVVATKVGILELVIDFGAMLVQFANAFREPGDEFLFAFQVREIPTEAKA